MNDCPHSNVPVPPPPSSPTPLPRDLRESSTGSGPLCPICRSDIKRRFWIFGKLLGCINEDCENYWRKPDDHTPDDA